MHCHLYFLLFAYCTCPWELYTSQEINGYPVSKFPCILYQELSLYLLVSILCRKVSFLIKCAFLKQRTVPHT